jgi:hypothetical protein
MVPICCTRSNSPIHEKQKTRRASGSALGQLSSESLVDGNMFRGSPNVEHRVKLGIVVQWRVFRAR